MPEEHALIDFDPRLLLSAEPPVSHPSNYEQVFAAWRQARAATANALHLDAFHTGSALTAISFAANSSPSLIHLDCDAHAASGWCLAAAAISPVPVKTIAEAGPASPPNLFIPGHELAGGVRSQK